MHRAEDEKPIAEKHYYENEHTQATVAANDAFEKNDSKSWHFKLGKSDKWGLRFNPVTTGVSIIIIWGFIAWCMAQPSEVCAGFNTSSDPECLWRWLHVEQYVAEPACVA